MTSIRTLAGLFAAATLSACGGGGGDGAPAPAPAPVPGPGSSTSAAPGGLYVGYYQEDPQTNPEDPTPGAFTLNLPSTDADFSGSMFFTYVGCQNSNVGAITGSKLGTALSGTWSGTIDGSSQKGSYAGVYDSTGGSYAGTYTNSAGKQYRDLSSCITYWIAPNGSWEMFPVDQQVPAGYTVTVSGRTVAWTATSGAALTLIYLLDPMIAQSSGNPVLWQTVVASGSSVVIPSSVSLQTGKAYIAAVGVSNADHARLAFGSRQFTF